MAYVVTENCDGCKFTDCVEVCPVDCFYQDAENPTMLYIDPDDCTNCDACVAECPVEAIYSEDDLPEGMEKYIEINEKGAQAPDAVNVSAKVDPLPGAEERKEQLGL